MKTISEKLKSIAADLFALAETIEAKGIGPIPANIQPYDVTCAIGASKARLEILLQNPKNAKPVQIKGGTVL